MLFRSTQFAKATMASMKTTFLLALIFLLLQTEFISLEAIWSNSSVGNPTVGCIEMEMEALCWEI